MKTHHEDAAMKTLTFENFPWRMVAVCNAVSLAIYAAGFYLMVRLGLAWGLLYVAYCAWVEWRILSRSCRHCYYFGRRCAFGRGRVCSWLFTKGSEETFRAKQVTWRDIAPDFLVSLIPLAAGIVLLIRSFSWIPLLAVAALVFLGSVGTGLVRRRIACRHCEQRERGCPAERLFAKAKEA